MTIGAHRMSRRQRGNLAGLQEDRARAAVGTRALDPPETPGSARERDDAMLAALGMETAAETAARLEASGRRAAAAVLKVAARFGRRAKLEATLAGLGATRGGKSRAQRWRCCGLAMVARRGEVLGWQRRGCRDRWCPACAERRASEVAGKLRAAALAPSGAPRGNLAFITLTQPRRPQEPPRDATRRLLRGFARLRHTAWWKRSVAGGVRCLEVTARAGAGVHAHLHIIVEWRRGEPGVDEPQAVEAVLRWCGVLGVYRACAEGGAEYAAQDAQDLVGDREIGQACGYPLKLAGLLDLLEAAPGYVLQVLAGLDGVRTVECFGSWRGRLKRTRADRPLEYGSCSVAALVTPDPPDVRFPSGVVTGAEAQRAVLGSRQPGCGADGDDV